MRTLFLTPMTDKAPKLEGPLGLMYIQAVLDKEGYESKIVDIYDSYDEIRQIINSYNPNIVGISCFTNYRKSSFELARVAKETNPSIIVVMGGPHATYLWEQMLRNIPEVDIIVKGEGEITYLELVKALENKTPLDKVDGIAFRKNNELYSTKERGLIQNLDSIPFPSYRDIDLSKYSNRIHVHSSRGCFNSCTYCATFWKNHWRGRSAKNVVDEIEWLVKEKGLKYLYFSDDIFTVDKQRAIDICKMLIDRKIDIGWVTETRVDSVSYEVLYWMKKAGCSILQFGVESGSPTILKNIKKNITLEQIRNAFKLCKEVGLKAQAFIMVGNQGETWETVRETERLLDEIKPDVLSVAIAGIFPNTELYRIAKEKGVIGDDFWLTNKTILKYTGEHTMGELLNMRVHITRHFYRTKGRFAFIKYVLTMVRKKPTLLTDHLKAYLGIKIDNEERN